MRGQVQKPDLEAALVGGAQQGGGHGGRHGYRNKQCRKQKVGHGCFLPERVRIPAKQCAQQRTQSNAVLEALKITLAGDSRDAFVRLGREV